MTDDHEPLSEAEIREIESREYWIARKAFKYWDEAKRLTSMLRQRNARIRALETRIAMLEQDNGVLEARVRKSTV